jgi:hypothetical protein
MAIIEHSKHQAPIVALFCTRGLEAFLANSILGLLNVGVAAAQIHVGCPRDAVESVAGVAKNYSIDIHVLEDSYIAESQFNMETYSEFDSEAFIDICWRKVHFIRDLLHSHRHVIYADLDISWLRNPVPYLSQVAAHYPMAFQTEALPCFPPVLCCGFASFLNSEATMKFLDALIGSDLGRDRRKIRQSDQSACRQIIDGETSWLRDIFLLPEALFLNGLGYKNLQGAGSCPMEGDLLPFLFHANWTIGIANKYQLLVQTGTWFVPGRSGPGEPPDLSRNSTQAEAPHPEFTLPEVNPPLLSVIYPVYDVRGEAPARIRLWTEEQDLEAHKYRVVVVAGTETGIDEASIRKVLRPHDIILRVGGVAGEPEYWNAGARKAETPWILFTEGHSMPKPDSLSALASWIGVNPDSEAVNFRVENIDAHRVAGLLKRWFALIHADWGRPSTWRRLHRTAFAIRSDVFADVGPFDPQLGHFAPPLLSARMHQTGRTISLLPTSSVVHDDSREMSAHHHDTADYVRGEMDARTKNEPVFFEKYFGSSPLSMSNSNLPQSYARTILAGILVAARHRPKNAYFFVKRAIAFMAPAVVGLRHRARLLGLLNRVDEFAIMHLPLTDNFRWNRFILAHGRVVRIGHMLWITAQPPAPLAVKAEAKHWQIDELGPDAIIGAYPLERHGDVPLRWTRPVFLLRLALAGNDVTVTLQTRNMRGTIVPSDIAVVAGGRIVAGDDLSIDETGSIMVRIGRRSPKEDETKIVVILRDLQERAVVNGDRRPLGLPLFSVRVSSDRFPFNGQV